MNKIVLSSIVLGAMMMAAAFVNYDTVKETLDVKTFELFQKWASVHNKQYGTVQEMTYRIGLFYKTLLKVTAHNKSGATWTEGLNQFSDMTLEEVKAKYFGLAANNDYNEENVRIFPEDTPVANDIDWNAAGAVTPVKNQGNCGSCWAFSATGALEGLYFLTVGQKQTLLSFSEQQLVDCSGSYGNQGCNGGLMNNAFQFVIKNGIDTETQYPYKAVQGTCQKMTATWTGLKSFFNVQKKSSSQLVKALNQQPVSVAIHADTIINYTGGVYSNPACGTQLDHGVLATGYTSDVWIVKNSWGTSWGEQGYIQFSRTADPDWLGGECGILLAASCPTD